MNTTLAKVELPDDEDLAPSSDDKILFEDNNVNKESENMDKFKNLFCKCKFYISRECPRECLVFIIRYDAGVSFNILNNIDFRSFGGEVSWDKTMGIGCTYDVTDETITHQIVDRPMKEQAFVSRLENYTHKCAPFSSLSYLDIMSNHNGYLTA